MTKNRTAVRATRNARVLLIAAVAIVATPCLAQDSRRAAALDSTFQRAQRLASDGDVAGARTIADSVLGASPEGSARFIEALFRRATFADFADAARRDYLRIVVEYALTPRAEDALLRLAQMEMARSDRLAARKYLDRLAREHSDGRLRAEGEYWLGRVWLEDAAVPQACSAFAEARARLSATDVELGNQISYYSRLCMTTGKAEEQRTRNDSGLKVEVTTPSAAAVRDDSVTGRPAADGKLRQPAVTLMASEAPAWSAQVAAYGSKADADRLAKRLQAHGFEARVTPEKPFRVRLGRFALRSAAATLVEHLRSQRITAMVVEAERP